MGTTLYTTDFLQLKLRNYLYQLRVGRIETIDPFYEARHDAYLVTFTHVLQSGVLSALKAALPFAMKHDDHHVLVEIPLAWWWSDSDQAQLEAKMHQEQEATLRIWQGGGIADAALKTLLNADPVVEGKRMIEAVHPLPTIIPIAEPPKDDDDTDTDFIPMTHFITPAQYRAEEFSTMQRRGRCIVWTQHNGERCQVEHITRDDESGEYGAHLKGIDAPVFPFNALLTVDWLHRDGNCDCISCLNAETQFADVDPIVVAPTSLIDNTLDHYQRRAETAEAILEDIRAALGIAKGDDVVEVARTAANLADAYQDAVKEIAALQNEHVRAMQLASMVRSHRNAIKHVLSDQRLIGANTLQLALTRELMKELPN